MTQTPPKPKKKQSDPNGNGFALPTFQVKPQPIAKPRSDSAKLPDSLVESSATAPKKAKTNFWQNLSFRGKLAILLIAGAALPVVAVTQGIVAFSQQKAQEALQESLDSSASGFLDDYLIWTRDEDGWQADNLATVIETTKIDLGDPKQVAENRFLLDSLVKKSFALQDAARSDTYKSFRLIANTEGKTVAQLINLQNQFALGASLEDEKIVKEVSRPLGIAIADVPIIRDALKTGQLRVGIELLEGKFLQRLGLEPQAKIENNSQAATDEARSALMTIAARPVKVDGKVVGIVVVGTLLNQNTQVDFFTDLYGATAAVYGGDLMVASTIPDADGENRLLGIQAPREAIDRVLGRGETYSTQEKIAGRSYLTTYMPLFDYQRQLNPEQAKPVGMAFIATSPDSIEGTIDPIQVVGYSIGAGILLLVGLLALPVASTFSRPLRRLQEFAAQVAAREVSARLEESDRRDEIGILSQELNQMAANIESSLKALRQEAAREQLLKEITLQLSQFPQVANAFDLVLEKTRLALKADRAMIYRLNEDTLEGSVIAESVAQGFPQALGATITDRCFANDFAEEYRQGRIQAISNIYEAGFSDCHLKILEPFAIKANLVVPILRGSRGYLAGLLCLSQCSAPRRWHPNQIALLKQVATQIGLAFDRANLLQQTQAAVERAQALKEITLKMAQQTQAQTIFETAVAEIRQVIHSDRVIVYRFERNWKGTVIAESVAPEFPQALGAEIADPCFADKYVEKYKQGRVQATTDIYQAGLTECHLKQLEPFEVKANLVAPILMGGELLGLLIAHQCGSTRHWETGIIDLFTQIATQVGLALERTNLLQQQQAEKELLQRRAMELLQEVDPVSRGDLTIRATVTEDEIGTVADSYNATIESLRKIVAQVKTAAQQMTATTSQNEVSVKTLSQEAVRQAADISQALERIQVMTESIRAVSQNAKQAEAVVREASQTVREGDRAMNQTVDGILAIRETVSETAEKVKRLGESSQKISKVVNLIGRFAAQTHLLALKASIEAARAGEDGQGFAVIADEVRTLASQSAEATAEIDNLVSNIQSETNEAVAAMAVGTERVVVGTKLVEQTRQSLTKIAQASTQIDDLVAAIAQAASAQSEASEVVTQTMSEVAGVSNQTSTEASEVAASFKELLTVAQELQKSVGQFKLN